MKRTLAAVAFLTALGALCKLAWKEPPAAWSDRARPEIATRTSESAVLDPETVLRARYPADRELVDRVLHEYHHNALAIERTDGRRGLVLLDRLGLEAVFLYEKYPKEFRRLAESLNDDAAADLLLHWREYFGLKRADDVDRGILIAEIAGLPPASRRLAAKYPNALPLILAEPAGVTDLIKHYQSDPDDLRDALVILEFISLESGAADLRNALRVLDAYGPLALDAFRLHGPDGFTLVALYGPILQALGDAMPLDDALIAVRVNADFLDERLRTHAPETLAGNLRHAAAVGLVEALGGSPHALRLSAEFGAAGDRALLRAGPDAADVVYEDYHEPSVRNQAVAALGEHGAMALAILAKYAPDPDFREILRRHGGRVIPPVAQSDPAPEALAALRAKDQRDKSWSEVLAQGVLAVSRDNGQATIRLIRTDGIERVESLHSDGIAFYQFLPLYDLLHLGRVVTRGQTPTGGEMAWALIDGCFIVADVLSLAALQPEGAAALEAARSEAKTLGREAVQNVGRELVQEATETGGRVLAREGSQATTQRLARWWTVRAAGGTYQVLRRLPEALAQMPLPEIARLGRPLAEKAGLRLSTFAPIRFLRDGVAIVKRIPPERGLKYAGAQAVQAGVGVVGFAKMEEHLRSRRP
jgi:hypothetical protein